MRWGGGAGVVCLFCVDACSVSLLILALTTHPHTHPHTHPQALTSKQGQVAAYCANLDALQQQLDLARAEQDKAERQAGPGWERKTQVSQADRQGRGGSPMPWPFILRPSPPQHQASLLLSAGGGPPIPALTLHPPPLLSTAPDLPPLRGRHPGRSAGTHRHPAGRIGSGGCCQGGGACVCGGGIDMTRQGGAREGG